MARGDGEMGRRILIEPENISFKCTLALARYSNHSFEPLNKMTRLKCD
ncbi:MAG: hypothetical protein F6K58_12635 [Symploca sp. SIO2E9]|nr:hypothetical protein [Symploca sp. SIO2E9]